MNKIKLFNNVFYYEIGLPWTRNKNTGNYSIEYNVIKELEHDFIFITKKNRLTGFESGIIVPKEVVKKNVKYIQHYYDKEVPDPNDETKTIIVERGYPCYLISKKVIMKYKEYILNEV
ncbi:hypothetical protein J6O48_06730 [bacterium]|nr:hypothetical protein [bacterium]